jgi:hypothetical protein
MSDRPPRAQPAPADGLWGSVKLFGLLCALTGTSAVRFASAVDGGTRVWWHAAGLVCAVGATLSYGRGLRAAILGARGADGRPSMPAAPAA